MTRSIGLTTLGPGDADIEVLLGRADSALHQAKAAGRNRVVVSGDAVDPLGANENLDGSI